MWPKLSFQNFKKNFKDASLKYIVVKFHNFTWSINHTVSNWNWGRWKFVWVFMRSVNLLIHVLWHITDLSLPFPNALTSVTVTNNCPSWVRDWRWITTKKPVCQNQRLLAIIRRVYQRSTCSPRFTLMCKNSYPVSVFQMQFLTFNKPKK